MWKQGSFRSCQFLKHQKGVTWKEKYQARSIRTTTSVFSQELSWESAKAFGEIPSPIALPIIGTAWQVLPIVGRYTLDRQHLANEDKRKRYGDIVREKAGSLNIVLCFSVEDVPRIVRAEGIYPNRTEFSTIKAYRESRKEWFSTTGLLALQGTEWFDLRSKTQKHLLKPLAVQEYLEPMQGVAKDFVKRMFEIRDENKEVPDYLQELCKWSLESVSLVGLDTRLGCLQSNLSPDSDGMKMIESVKTQLDCMTNLEPFLGNLQFWKLFRTPTWRKFEKASDVFSEIAFRYINKALDELKQKKRKQGITLLQAMLAKNDLNVSDAVVFVADMMMAGIETTSHTLAFLQYHLARNPEKQEILHQEVMKLLPTENTKLNPTIFESLKYLRACLKESTRLSPIVGGIARILAEDTVLSGYRVPAGTMVFVPNQAIHMDEKIFKNASQFLPERWLNKEERPNPFAFIPFGFGPRSCIGKRLAEVEMVALAAEITRNFRIEYHFEDIGVYTKLLHIPDKPFRFNFIDR